MTDMKWYALLPSGLRDGAYKADNDELAWPRESALRVVELLLERGYAITGVDVWIPTIPGPTIPTPFVYDWKLKGIPRTDKNPGSALDFIRQFDWDASDSSHGNMEPVFNIWAQAYQG
jgi:hypothetical protein